MRPSNSISSEIIFENIISKVLPVAIKHISNVLGVEYDPKFEILDPMTKMCIRILYKNYLKILTNCSSLEEICELLQLERVSDLENIHSFQNVNELIKMINIVRSSSYTKKTTAIDSVMILWGFLPILEDILYSKKMELPITMPSYFHSFYMVYNNKHIAERYLANESLMEEDCTFTLKATLKYLGIEKELFKTEFNIECSTVEGMFTYAYFHNLKDKEALGKIKFFVDGEKVDILKYVLDKKSLLLVEDDGNLPTYTSIVEPFGEVVNYMQSSFVTGFNCLNEIAGGFRTINEYVDNRPESEFVKT